MSREILVTACAEWVLVYSGVKTCGPRQHLNREWHVAINRSSLIPEMLLELPINVKRVCHLLGYKVDERRVERLRAAASEDLLFLDDEEFNKVIILQLALTHVRRSRQRHIITGREIVEWLLLSYSEHLTGSHALSLRVIDHLFQMWLVSDGDVSERIQHFEIAWRRSTCDFLCIGAAMHVFYAEVSMLFASMTGRRM